VPANGDRTAGESCLPSSRATAAPTIFLSAAEPSADRVAAALIVALRARLPSARFLGVAGPRMQAAGCQATDDMTPRAAMLAGAARNVLAGWSVLRRIGRLFRQDRPDLVVLLDSPTLHLRVARRVKAHELPVLYYIAPQVWAWGQRRVKIIRQCVDRLACILPFEPDYFRQHGIPACFVGHPLFEDLADRQLDRKQVATLASAGDPVLALLPGSRRHVVQEVLPGQLDTARIIKQNYPQAAVLISAANPQAHEIIACHSAVAELAATVVPGEPDEMIAAADLVLAASGTGTLHAAAQQANDHHVLRLAVRLLAGRPTPDPHAAPVAYQHPGRPRDRPRVHALLPLGPSDRREGPRVAGVAG
jgi:lipid-A-disaccharide synthase